MGALDQLFAIEEAKVPATPKQPRQSNLDMLFAAQEPKKPVEQAKPAAPGPIAPGPRLSLMPKTKEQIAPADPSRQVETLPLTPVPKKGAWDLAKRAAASFISQATDAAKFGADYVSKRPVNLQEAAAEKLRQAGGGNKVVDVVATALERIPSFDPLASVKRGVKAVGPKPFAVAQQKAQKFSQEVNVADIEWEKASLKEKMTTRLGESIYNVIPSVAGSLAPYLVNPALGFSVSAGSVAEDVKQKAVKSGVQEKTAEEIGLATGLAVGVLDKIVPDKMVPGGAKKQFIGGFLKRMLKSSATEGATEVAQENIQLAAEATFRKDLGWDEVETRNAMAALGGLIGGSGINVVVGAIQKAGGYQGAPQATTEVQPTQDVAPLPPPASAVATDQQVYVEQKGKMVPIEQVEQVEQVQTPALDKVLETAAEPANTAPEPAVPDQQGYVEEAGKMVPIEQAEVAAEPAQEVKRRQTAEEFVASKAAKFRVDTSYQGKSGSGRRAVDFGIDASSVPDRDILSLQDVSVRSILEKIQGNPDHLVTVYRGAPEGSDINNGDFVTLSKSEAEKYTRTKISRQRIPGTTVYAKVVKAGDLAYQKGLPDAQFGYFPQKNRNRKILQDNTGQFVNNQDYYAPRKQGLPALHHEDYAALTDFIDLAEGLFRTDPRTEIQIEEDATRLMQDIFGKDVAGKSNGQLSRMAKSIVDGYETKDTRNAKFRLKEDLAAKGIEVTDAQEDAIIKLNRDIFGDGDIRIMGQILVNQEALGKYQRGIIEILGGQADPKATFYHEAVHKYLDVFTDRAEHIAILKEGQRKYGIDDFAEIEERIAEDFIVYAKSRTGVAGKLRLYFDRLIQRLTSFAGDRSKIEALYADIAAGKAKDKPQPSRRRPRNQKLESRVYSRLQAEVPGLDEDVTYQRQNLQENIDKAIDMVEEDPQQAYRVAMGVEAPPQGQTSTAVNIVMSEKALEDGDRTLYAQLVKQRSIEQTRRGQEIVAEKSSVTDNSTARYVKELVKARMEKLEKTTFARLSDMKLGGKKKSRAILAIDHQVDKAVEAMKSKKELDIAEAQALIDSLACK